MQVATEMTRIAPRRAAGYAALTDVWFDIYEYRVMRLLKGDPKPAYQQAVAWYRETQKRRPGPDEAKYPALMLPPREWLTPHRAKAGKVD